MASAKYFNHPHKRVLGQVGTVDVDARTGQLKVPASFQQTVSQGDFDLA